MEGLDAGRFAACGAEAHGRGRPAHDDVARDFGQATEALVFNLPWKEIDLAVHGESSLDDDAAGLLQKSCLGGG